MLNLVLFQKYEKYEIKYRTKICDFTVDQKEAVARYSMVVQHGGTAWWYSMVVQHGGTANEVV